MVGGPRRRTAQSQASRWHRGAWAAVSAVAVIAIAAFSAHASGDTDVEPPLVPGAADGATCQGQPTREPCEDIEIAGRLWRYALLPAARPTADTVVVDFGGPGLAVLSGEARIGAFRTAYPALASRYNIVVPEEPWVTQTIKPECEGSMSRHYLTARSTGPRVNQTAKDIAGACGLAASGKAWGFTPSSYAGLIRAIATRHSLTIKGFVGKSWASVRLSYLGSMSIEWAALLRPYPIGVSADALVAERTRLLEKFASPVRPMSTGRTAGRSIDVGQFDQFSAVVQLGYLEDGAAQSALPGVLDGTAVAEIGRLSDAVWLRYGTDSISPGWLAQLQEQCSVIGPTSWDLSAHAVDIRWVVAAQLAPCASLPRSPAGSWSVRRACVVSSPLDTVTPEALIFQTYANKSNGIQFVQSTKRSHSSFDGLETCLERIAG